MDNVPIHTNNDANLDQLIGEEDQKLQAISDICSNRQVQLYKVKRCIEKGDEVSKRKGIKLCRRCSGILKTTEKKYCESVETMPIEETPPLIYLNKL